MERESVTLEQLDAEGRDVEAWCAACDRRGRVDTIIWQHFARKGWATKLEAAAVHFRCTGCRSSAAVTLSPCPRPEAPPADAQQVTTDMVAAIFFGSKREAKSRRAGSASGPTFDTHRVRWWPKRR